MLAQRFILLIILLSLTSGCAPTSIVAKNARHLSLEFAAQNHDINTRTLITDNQNLAERFLQQFYVLGLQDRKKGFDEKQAHDRITSFSKDSAFNPYSQKSIYINHSYDANNPDKQATLLLNTAIKTYWDGYKGII